MEGAEQRGLAPQPLLHTWLVQVASALDYCHSIGLAHRDVKPENVLLVPESGSLAPLSSGKASSLLHWQGHVAKLCDFGSSTLTTPSAPSAPCYGAVGSSMYAAPEVLRLHMVGTDPQSAEALWPGFQEALSEESRAAKAESRAAAPRYCGFLADAWSFGVMAFVLAAGRPPFRTASPSDASFRAFVRSTQPDAVELSVCAPEFHGWKARDAVWQWPAEFSPGFIALLTACMQVVPQQRPQPGTLGAHPWLQDIAWVPSHGLQSGAPSMPSGSMATACTTAAAPGTPPTPAPPTTPDEPGLRCLALVRREEDGASVAFSSASSSWARSGSLGSLVGGGEDTLAPGAPTATRAASTTHVEHYLHASGLSGGGMEPLHRRGTHSAEVSGWRGSGFASGPLPTPGEPGVSTWSAPSPVVHGGGWVAGRGGSVGFDSGGWAGDGESVGSHASSFAPAPASLPGGSGGYDGGERTAEDAASRAISASSAASSTRRRRDKRHRHDGEDGAGFVEEYIGADCATTLRTASGGSARSLASEDGSKRRVVAISAHAPLLGTNWPTPPPTSAQSKHTHDVGSMMPPSITLESHVAAQARQASSSKPLTAAQTAAAWHVQQGGGH